MKIYLLAYEIFSSGHHLKKKFDTIADNNLNMDVSLR